MHSKHATTPHVRTSGTGGTRKPDNGVQDAQLKQQLAHERIRQHAYEIYLARKGGPGNPVSDWLQAEQELLATLRDTQSTVDRKAEARGNTLLASGSI